MSAITEYNRLRDLEANERHRIRTTAMHLLRQETGPDWWRPTPSTRHACRLGRPPVTIASGRPLNRPTVSWELVRHRDLHQDGTQTYRRRVTVYGFRNPRCKGLPVDVDHVPCPPVIPVWRS